MIRKKIIVCIVLTSLSFFLYSSEAPTSSLPIVTASYPALGVDSDSDEEPTNPTPTEPITPPGREPSLSCSHDNATPIVTTSATFPTLSNNATTTSPVTPLEHDSLQTSSPLQSSTMPALSTSPQTTFSHSTAASCSVSPSLSSDSKNNASAAPSSLAALLVNTHKKSPDPLWDMVSSVASSLTAWLPSASDVTNTTQAALSALRPDASKSVRRRVCDDIKNGTFLTEFPDTAERSSAIARALSQSKRNIFKERDRLADIQTMTQFAAKHNIQMVPDLTAEMEDFIQTYYIDRANLALQHLSAIKKLSLSSTDKKH